MPARPNSLVVELELLQLGSDLFELRGKDRLGAESITRAHRSKAVPFEQRTRPRLVALGRIPRRPAAAVNVKHRWLCVHVAGDSNALRSSRQAISASQTKTRMTAPTNDSTIAG